MSMYPLNDAFRACAVILLQLCVPVISVIGACREGVFCLTGSCIKKNAIQGGLRRLSEIFQHKIITMNDLIVMFAAKTRLDLRGL